MKKRYQTDLERNNTTVLYAHACNVIIMLIFFLLQALSGTQPFFFFIIALILGFGPVAAEIYFWKEDFETPKIKHLCSIGFAVFYTFSIFTSTNNLVFLFVIPMILVISVYNDTRYSILINIGAVLENIVLVILGANTGKFGYTSADSAIIQITVMLIVGFFSYYTSKTLNLNLTQKLDDSRESEAKTQQLFTDLSTLSEHINAEINNISKQLSTLNDSSKNTLYAMQEVANGASDTANAVQEQALQSKSIQEKTQIVESVSASIEQNMELTLSIVSAGNEAMDALVKQVDTSVSNSELAATKLNTLDGYMNEMHTIVELIDDITSQTSLLALNASIEAARAGEAGKGFAVVATEITQMSTRTKDATVQITELIENVTSAIKEVVSVIGTMITGISCEKESVENTATNFSQIKEHTNSIQQHVEHLAESAQTLKDANQVIVDSVQTISAVTEELSAHATETIESESSNSEILDGISDKMQELIAFIQKCES